MSTTAARIVGFDWLRVLALLLVTVFHALGLLGLDAWTKMAGLSMGTLGVSLFLALSGALIGNDGRPAFEWLVASIAAVLMQKAVSRCLGFFLNPKPPG
ncbi:MAG: acyltransferase family protein [Planctomycetota bacterium]|nr:acyltransferase family protein [Planctomycetota bacterium]